MGKIFIFLFFNALMMANLVAATNDPVLFHTRALWGYQAQDHSGIVTSHNEDRLFMPASVLKLVTSAAALHYLGAEYTVKTRLYSHAKIVKGKLQGDLIIQGMGDPTWNEHFYPKYRYKPLAKLVKQLKSKGIRRIAGDLLLDTHFFAGPAQPMLWSSVEKALAYGAPVSSLALDENMIWLKVAPGRRVGAKGRISSLLDTFAIKNNIITVGEALHGKGTVTFLPSLDRHTIGAIGEYPVSEPAYSVKISMPDPDWHVAMIFKRLLRKQGIQLQGKIKLRQSQTQGRLLASIESLPLSQWLPRILSNSKNWYAETLLRMLAYQQRKKGRLDTGLAVLAQFLEHQVGVEKNSFYLVDASGLSAANLITPETVINLLQYAWKQPWRDTFVTALAAQNKGSLASWGRLPRISAKTGTIQHTMGLAGYLFKPKQKIPVFFAVFVNHHPGKRRLIKRDMVDWVRDLLD